MLSYYLSTLPSPSSSSKRKAIELGAGVGYLSLVLASLGYDVISTDIQPVLDDVLRPNITTGLDVLSRRSAATPVFSGRVNDRLPSRLDPTSTAIPLGEISVHELDWTKMHHEPDVRDYEVDMIITSDTVYHPDLLPHLFRTIALISAVSTRSKGTPPIIYLCLERRDTRMVDFALDLASTFNLHLKRVGQGRIAKSVKETGWGWKTEDWEGVEVYKGKWVKDIEDASSGT